MKLNIDRAEIDAAGMLCVEGPLPPGIAVKLAARRYKSKPAWWGVDVVGVGPEAMSHEDGRRYRMECPITHISGREGIEVFGANTTISIPREKMES